MLIDIKAPQLAESVSEADVLAWEKKTGEWVKAGEKLVELETDKVVLEVPAPQSGVLTAIIKHEGSTVESGELLAQLDTKAKMDSAAVRHEDSPQISSATSEKESSAPEQAGKSAEVAKTGPAVRRLAEQRGIDLKDVPHEGERITGADVRAYEADKANETSVSNSKAPSPPAGSETTQNSGGRIEQRVPMSRLRKRVAERLLSAQHEHAILSTFNEVNMQPVMDLRARYKEIFQKKHEVKLGFMSFFTKAVVVALQKFPVINASIDGNDVVYHGYYDIGIAVSSPRGLVVPIVRDADALSFAEIEQTISALGQRAQSGHLGIEDLQGGTFTITNGGIFGSMLSTPILNPPQSAILGMHNIVQRPVAENGEVLIRPIMYVALSYDHRLIDGSDAVRFLVEVKQGLEDPARLLLEC